MANLPLLKLREKMTEKNIDMLLIPTTDPHGSEYVGEHFKARKHFSGFTGSAGVLLVSSDKAGLWTDGRYFLQAERELQGMEVDLFKSGQPGVPELFDYIAENIKGTLGADLRTLSAAEGKELEEKGIKLADCAELIDQAWEGRPTISLAPAYTLSSELAGESAAERIARVRAELDKESCKAIVLSALEDVAWLFNIRGSDVLHLPVALAYAVVEKDNAYLFIAPEKREAIAADMAAIGVTLMDYDEVYSFITRYEKADRIMANGGRLNYRLYLALTAKAEMVEGDPISIMKAVKNPTELANMRRIHLDDGVTLTRFIRWVKEAVKEGVTEVQAGAKLDAMRVAQENCTDISFETICGYGPHGAIIHYGANADTDIAIEAKGLLLVDSGGQYIGGTTDVTRTIAVGEVSPEQKKGFTIVLESMLALQDIKFPRGCAGYNLDAIARMPFWERGLDYNHGTGHGVGYMLSVHEGPNGFRWKKTARSDRAEMLPGMITSDEPGIYIAGEYGVRIENLVECVEAETNEYGSFLAFKPLTYAPIDLDAVDMELLSDKGRERLNRYHAEVYEKLAPLMTEEERAWLREQTRAI